jgi:hypothetical protein
MIYELSSEIKNLLGSQPRLKIEENKVEYIIQGEYVYSLNFNDCILQGERNIKLIVKKNFPNSIPKFYLFDYPEHIEHIYQDGNVCLATIGEMIHFLNENPSLVAFIKKFVNAFIYTLDWFEKYKTYPFGDRKHGYKGLLDYYLNDLNLTKQQYKNMTILIYEKKYRGHMPCICGSGKKLRDCHGKYMLPIIKNTLYEHEFINEALMILTEDGKNVSK